jgi:hypothetical protein
MFVSTSAVTLVQLLACPASPLDGSGRRSFVPFRLAGSGLVEPTQTLERITGRGLPPRRNDADRVPGDQPLDLVAGPNSIVVGHRFGDGDLELRGNFGHVLTLSRSVSLFKGFALVINLVLAARIWSAKPKS